MQCILVICTPPPPRSVPNSLSSQLNVLYILSLPLSVTGALHKAKPGNLLAQSGTGLFPSLHP